MPALARFYNHLRGVQEGNVLRLLVIELQNTETTGGMYHDGTNERRIACAHRGAGEKGGGREAHRGAGISRGRKGWRQRLRAGKISGHLVLRAMESPVERCRRPARLPGRK